MKSKGNKAHVREALLVLLAFCKAQRKKVSDYMREQRRKNRIALAATVAAAAATAAIERGVAPMPSTGLPSSPTSSTLDNDSDSLRNISIDDVDWRSSPFVYIYFARFHVDIIVTLYFLCFVHLLFVSRPRWQDPPVPLTHKRFIVYSSYFY